MATEIKQYEPPTDRKPWVVAKLVYNSEHDTRFISSLILDLARRKIVEIKTEKSEIYVKILKDKQEGLDEVERSFLDLLKKIQEDQDSSSKVTKKFKRYKSNGFAKLPKIIIWKFYNKDEEEYVLNPIYKSVNSLANEKIRKEFYPKMSTTRKTLLYSTLCLIGVIMTILNETRNFLFSLVLFIITIIILIFNAKYIVINQEYRDELKKWASFGIYLSENKHIDDHGHKGVILWGKWYCYGVALGAIKNGFFPIIKSD